MYEGIALIARYVFVALFAVMVIGLILVSYNEYKEKKRILAFAGIYLGFAEVIYSDDEEYIGEKFGITQTTNIGTSSRADILLSGKNIFKKHCIIYDKENELYIRPINGITQLNGIKIEEEKKLKEGDILLIGETALLVHLKEVRE